MIVQKPSRRQSTVMDAKPNFGPGFSPMPQTPGSPSFSRASSLARERETSVGPEQRRVLRIKRLVRTFHVVYCESDVYT